MGVREFSAAQAEAAESPSPPPCEVTGIDPSPAHVCRGETITFTAQGTDLDAVRWTARHADPENGTGAEFTTKWATQPEGGYSGVDAVCGESSAYSRVTITAVFKIFNDADPSEIEHTSVCPGTEVTLIAEPRPLISGFPSGQPVWRILDQPEGSTLADPPAGNYQASITPTVPRTYFVEARCGTSSRTFKIYCVRVTFSPNPVRTGFNIPWEQLPILTRVTATVEPAFAMPDVSFDVGGTGTAGQTRVTIKDFIAPVGNTYLFNLRAYSATPHQIPGGDTTIRALVKGQVCDEVPVIVVIPRTIHEPFPQADGNVEPENLVLDRDSSPAWRVRRDEVELVTAWFHWLTVTVEDQFGDVLDDIYDRAEVEERVSRVQFDINQQLRGDGTYLDPVGVVSRPPTSRVRADSEAANEWPDEETLTMVASTQNQVIRVLVGGHEIGNIIRDVIATPPNHIRINWPP